MRGDIASPTKWEEYIGQKEAKRALDIYLKSASIRGDALDHIILFGRPGLGKTTLANLIAGAQGGDMHSVNSGAIKTRENIQDIMAKVHTNDVVFLDEVHRLSLPLQEIFYELMEDFTMPICNDGEIQTMWVYKNTIIGATTMIGDVSQPMRDRFSIQIELHQYNLQELSAIIINAANRIDTAITTKAAGTISQRSRGTARIAINYLKRARDMAVVMNDNLITEEVVYKTFKLLCVDRLGLTPIDYRYLRSLSDKPKGVNTIAQTIGEKTSTIEQMIEPYLIECGLIEKTPKGRMLTLKGCSHTTKEGS